LDELIRVSETARNKLLTVEDLTEIELAEMKESLAQVADRGGIGEGSWKAARRHPRCGPKGKILFRERTFCSTLSFHDETP
jgi:low affinity Fe/Cu permease